MIDFENLRDTVVSGLSDFLAVPVVQTSQNSSQAGPYLSYAVTIFESENKGTWGVYQDGIERKPVFQTWTLSAVSNEYLESVSLAAKAKEWLDHTGTCFLNDHDVIVQSISKISGKENIVNDGYEFVNSFDVSFYLMSEADVPTDIGTIETAVLSKI